MELTSLVKRGPGRPVKSPVRAALDAPLPDGLQDAIDRVRRALKAEELVYSYKKELDVGSEAEEQKLISLRRDLNAAVIRREVADRLGDDTDAPTESDIEKLQVEVDAANARLGDRASREAAFASERERLRSERREAGDALWRVMGPWIEAVRDAAEKQVAGAAQLAWEAYLANDAVYRGGYPKDVTIPTVKGFGFHHSPEKIEVDPLVENAIHAHALSLSR